MAGLYPMGIQKTEPIRYIDKYQLRSLHFESLGKMGGKGYPHANVHRSKILPSVDFDR